MGADERMSCCGRRQTNGDAPAGSGGGLELFIDWRTQTPGALANGVPVAITTSLGPLTFAVQIALLDTLTLGATGLVWDAGVTNTPLWNVGGVITATALQATLADLYALMDIDVTWMLRIDHYSSVLTVTGTGGLVHGIWGANGSPANAGARLAGGGRSRQANVQVWRPAIAGTGVNYTTAPGPDTNVHGLTIRSQAIQAHSGTWPGSGLWEDLRCPIEWGVGKISDIALTQPMQDQNNLLLMSWATGGIDGDATVTTEQSRIQAMPSFA